MTPDVASPFRLRLKLSPILFERMTVSNCYPVLGSPTVLFKRVVNTQRSSFKEKRGLILVGNCCDVTIKTEIYREYMKMSKMTNRRFLCRDQDRLQKG